MIKVSAWVVSFFIILTNFILRMSVKYFSAIQKHFSNSKFNQSYVNMYIMLVFFNSAFMPYLVHTFVHNAPKE